MEFLSQVWSQASQVQSTPTWWVSAAAMVLALVLVVPRRVWPVSRNVVTIAHEGGHALVAFLVGRRLAGIQLHSDTSGVTVSSGAPTGLGMIATAFAGYVAPSLLGLGGVVLLSHGRVMATLWAMTLLLALMFVLIRNFYGALTVAITGLGVFAVSWWTPATVQTVFACAMVWFLLLAGPRPVWELHAKRRTGEAEDSDADQLARLTGIPGVVWVGLFALVAFGSLIQSARLTFL